MFPGTLALIATTLAGGTPGVPGVPGVPGLPETIALRGIEIDLSTPYCLEGRIKAPGGEAWLRAEVRGADGAVISSHETPRVRGADAWTYTASEASLLDGEKRGVAQEDPWRTSW